MEKKYGTIVNYCKLQFTIVFFRGMWNIQKFAWCNEATALQNSIIVS